MRPSINETAVQIAYVILQTFIVCICLFYINYVYTNNILPDKEAKDNFIQTECLINNKYLATTGHLIPQYKAMFLINYTVSNQIFARWVSGNGLDVAYSTNKQSQQTVLDQFDVGGSYPCWYDPALPQVALLVMRHSWLSTLPLLIPAVVGMICLYYLIINISLLMANAKKNIRENRKKKRK